MRNKKGQFFLLLIVGAVLVIIALGFGFLFFSKIVGALGSNYFIIGALIAVALVFHSFVETVLLSLWGWIQAIVKGVFSL